MDAAWNKKNKHMNTPPPHTSAEIDTGLICLIMLARFHGISLSAEQLSHQFSTPGQHFSMEQLLLAARKSGLKARTVHTCIARLEHTPLPALAVAYDGTFFILARLQQGQVLIHDPHSARPDVVSGDALERPATASACR